MLNIGSDGSESTVTFNVSSSFNITLLVADFHQSTFQHGSFTFTLWIMGIFYNLLLF